jgi:hypothetical protein
MVTCKKPESGNYYSVHAGKRIPGYTEKAQANSSHLAMLLLTITDCPK